MTLSSHIHSTLSAGSDRDTETNLSLSSQSLSVSTPSQSKSVDLSQIVGSISSQSLDHITPSSSLSQSGSKIPSSIHKSLQPFNCEQSIQLLCSSFSCALHILTLVRVSVVTSSH